MHEGRLLLEPGWRTTVLDLTQFAVTGVPAPGGVLTLSTGGPASQAFFHLLGSKAIDAQLPPFGSLLVGVPLSVIGSGAVPGTSDLTIPADLGLVGLEFFLQSLARRSASPIGSFSRRIRQVVQ